ncbi:hypothetical protein N7465_001252 [Penicillium sp. CMV-2018d]|nr:hypothetical protein N7465_001252 [Penicillium sp. CMV-2018d]
MRDGISFGWSWMWGNRDGAKPPKIPLPPAEDCDRVNPKWFHSGISQPSTAEWRLVPYYISAGGPG